MQELGVSELRLLGRLVINPSLRQVGLAKELQVSRSAVNQIWSNLARNNNLIIRGTLDYGKIGLQMVFGWATAAQKSDVLTKFSRWLKSSRLVTMVLPSVISSTFNSHIYFEAVLPPGEQAGWFYSQIDRFRKKPYSLKIHTTECSRISHHMNLGLYDGDLWKFPDNFRLEASIGAARSYAEILPNVGTVTQSSPTVSPPEILITAAALEDDYYLSSTKLSNYYSDLGLISDSSRSLRRRIARVRKDIVSPYVEISEIGLTQRLLVCIREENQTESTFAQVLHAQAGAFPKARVISGPNLTLLELELPSHVEWLTLSQVLSSLVGNASEICTFIADLIEKGTRLRGVVSYLISRMPSGKSGVEEIE